MIFAPSSAILALKYQDGADFVFPWYSPIMKRYTDVIKSNRHYVANARGFPGMCRL